MRPSSMVKAAAAISLGLLCSCRGEPRAPGCPFEAAEPVPNEGWSHSSEEELRWDHNPPASGRHLGVWASYGVHDDVVKRGNWVHNLEHGAIILLIGDSATADAEQTLRDAFEAIPDDPDCGHKRTILTRDPELDSAVAAVAADIVMEGDVLGVDDVAAFAEACRDRAPEDICL